MKFGKGCCNMRLFVASRITIYTTVIVIEHDLDVIRNADYIVDMGPGGGTAGGTIVACGTVEKVRKSVQSVTGKYI